MEIGDLQDMMEDRSVNFGAMFAEYLAKLKMKHLKGTGAKKETMGSLLTPIFRHLWIRMDGVTIVRTRLFMDAAHLTRTHWLKEGRLWTYVDDDGDHLLELPQWTVTDLGDDVTSLAFHPDPILRRNPVNRPHRRAIPRAAGAAAAQTHPDIPDFLHIPDIPMREHGVFQRFVVDALHAILARVSQCRCVSRGSVCAILPSAAGLSRRLEDDTDDDTDED